MFRFSGWAVGYQLLFQQWSSLRILDVGESFKELLFVRTAAELECYISCRTDHSCGDLQQFQTDGIDLLFSLWLDAPAGGTN